MRFATRLGALEEREFRLFFSGQAISLLGDGMAPLALAFAVLDLTGSPTDLGFVFAARMIPWVASLLVGGVFADRFSRRGVMVGADLLRFASQWLAARSPVPRSRASSWRPSGPVGRLPPTRERTRRARRSWPSSLCRGTGRS